jgi:hypothetical protein
MSRKLRQFTGALRKRVVELLREGGILLIALAPLDVLVAPSEQRNWAVLWALFGIGVAAFVYSVYLEIALPAKEGADVQQ